MGCLCVCGVWCMPLTLRSYNLLWLVLSHRAKSILPLHGKRILNSLLFVPQTRIIYFLFRQSWRTLNTNISNNNTLILGGAVLCAARQHERTRGLDHVIKTNTLHKSNILPSILHNYTFNTFRIIFNIIISSDFMLLCWVYVSVFLFTSEHV